MTMRSWHHDESLPPVAVGCPAMDGVDVRLADEVARLSQTGPRTRAARITVEVRNRVVILDGTDRDLEMRRSAAETACGTPGVHDVCHVRSAGSPDQDALAAPERPTSSPVSPR